MSAGAASGAETDPTRSTNAGDSWSLKTCAPGPSSPSSDEKYGKLQVWRKKKQTKTKKKKTFF
jgi:hypothetical protein